MYVLKNQEKCECRIAICVNFFTKYYILTPFVKYYILAILDTYIVHTTFHMEKKDKILIKKNFPLHIYSFFFSQITI